MDPHALSRRCVIHVDIDSFFLAVHRRLDPSLDDAKPLVLWQYQDTICATRPAKACGVRKHMRRGEARPLVEPRGGALVHAFCRDWPGPRVNYSRYNAASREFFAAFEDARDAGTAQPFFGKRSSSFVSSAATSTDAAAARKAGNMSPDALREVARAFAATDRHVASLRDAARARRRGVVLLAATFAAAAFFLLLPATRSLFVSRGDAPRRDRRRRSRTPPLDGLRPPPDETEEDRDDRPGAEKEANPIEFAARQPLPGADDAAFALTPSPSPSPVPGLTPSPSPSPVPSVILISSSDTDGTDDGTGDGGYAVVSHDETFDEAEATRRRSEEARRSTAPDPARFPPLDIFAVTVGDVSRAIEGVRRDEKDAIAFMRAFSDHPDVLHWRIPVADKHRRPWTDHVGRDAGVDARDLAAYHDAVLRFVRARVSFDDAEGRRVAYVEGVLRKYADSV